jgi:hypothetical protein
MVTVQSNSGFKDARYKVNYLCFRHYTSNALHKPKMSRILLEVVLPVCLVLKFHYKYVGDTILPHKVSALRLNALGIFLANEIIPASLRGYYLLHQQPISHTVCSLSDEGTDPSGRAFDRTPSKVYQSTPITRCLMTYYEAYGVNILGRSIRFELKHHNVYDAHFVIIR